MPTVEDIIVQRYQMTLEDFIARGPQIVPAYYGRMINAINAEDSEELQKYLLKWTVVLLVEKMQQKIQ